MKCSGRPGRGLHGRMGTPGCRSGPRRAKRREGGEKKVGSELGAPGPIPVRPDVRKSLDCEAGNVPCTTVWRVALPQGTGTTWMSSSTEAGSRSPALLSLSSSSTEQRDPRPLCPHPPGLGQPQSGCPKEAASCSPRGSALPFLPRPPHR